MDFALVWLLEYEQIVLSLCAFILFPASEMKMSRCAPPLVVVVQQHVLVHEKQVLPAAVAVIPCPPHHV